MFELTQFHVTMFKSEVVELGFLRFDWTRLVARIHRVNLCADSLLLVLSEFRELDVPFGFELVREADDISIH